MFYIIAFYFFVKQPHVVEYEKIEFEKAYKIDVTSCKIDRGYVFNIQYITYFSNLEDIKVFDIRKHVPFTFVKEINSNTCFLIKNNDTLVYKISFY